VIISSEKSNKMNETCIHANLDSLLKGETSFCQFVDIENTPNLAQLKEGFYKGCAFIARPLQAGVDILIPVRIKGTTSLETFAEFENSARPAKSNIFPTADSKILETVVSSNESVEESKINGIRESWNIKISDLVEGSNEHVYTAICIQCKNSTSEKDDLYKVDLTFAGVDGASDLPCIAIKHSLRMDKPIIKPMQYTDRPYIHGIIIKSLDHIKMLPNLHQPAGDKAEYNRKFFAQVLDVLGTKLNPYAQISSIDLKLQAASFQRQSFNFTDQVFKKQNI
jgi:hypothetical protein